MKSNIKIMSACALLVAVANCYGGEQKGQKVTVNIQNVTDFSVYGNIYTTNAAGTVKFTNDTQYFVIDPKTCIQLPPINKSLNRKTEFNRLVFSAQPWSLKQRVQFKKRQSDVNSTLMQQTLLPQFMLNAQSTENECYSINGTQKKLKVTYMGSGDKCTGCGSLSSANIINYVKDIKLEAQASGKETVMGEYLSGVAAVTKKPVKKTPGKKAQGLEEQGQALKGSAQQLTERERKTAEAGWTGAAKGLFGIK